MSSQCARKRRVPAARDQRLFAHGTRVRILHGRHSGREGVVVFTGAVKFAKGIWVGLVLDFPLPEQTHGDGGEVGGVRYFRVPRGHSGIFVKGAMIGPAKHDVQPDDSSADERAHTLPRRLRSHSSSGGGGHSVIFDPSPHLGPYSTDTHERAPKILTPHAVARVVQAASNLKTLQLDPAEAEAKLPRKVRHMRTFSTASSSSSHQLRQERVNSFASPTIAAPPSSPASASPMSPLSLTLGRSNRKISM